MLKKIVAFLLFIPFSILAHGGGKLYQASTIGALTLGVFDGDVLYSDIKKYGDFGLGTFEGLNGEMVALNGYYYRIDPKGDLYKVRRNDTAPFAQVVHFKATKSFQLKNISSYSNLTKAILSKIKNKNLPYAIKITGHFDDIFMRSLLHYKKPYPNLVKASKEQTEFNLRSSDGTLVGFWFPQYWGVIAVNGLHLHFVNKQLTKGGHVLNMKIKKGLLQIMPIQTVEIKLPNTKTFASKNFDAELHAQIEKAEGSTK